MDGVKYKIANALKINGTGVTLLSGCLETSTVQVLRTLFRCLEQLPKMKAEGFVASYIIDSRTIMIEKCIDIVARRGPAYAKEVFDQLNI